MEIGEQELIGTDDYLPDTLRVLRTAGRVAPKALEELSGSGLLTYSGTVATTA